MGFDLFLHMSLMMDVGTGKPFYYGMSKESGKVEKIFEIPPIDIPEHLRKYLYGRGHHFHVYTEEFNHKDVFHVDVSAFLEQFPSWAEFTESDYYTDEPGGWTYEDHKNFKKLLKLLEEQKVSFTVSWSY